MLRYFYNDRSTGVGEGEWKVSTVKEEVKSLLSKLPDDCTYEDVQYHLYVIEKIHRGIRRAESEGAIPQEEVEKHFDRC
jgi:hypothetical protein